MPTGTAMHHVAGTDRPFAPILVTYDEPKPKQTGLDWSKLRAPEPEPAERAAFLERVQPKKLRPRARRLAAPRKPRPPRQPRLKVEHRCACGNTRSPKAQRCADCYHRQQTAQAEAARNTCECGTRIGAKARRCRSCNAFHRNTQRPSVDVQAAISEYHAGDTIPTIANRHGWSIKTLRRAMQKAGVTFRDDRARASGGHNKITDPTDLVNQVRALYTDQGLSITHVGAELGLTRKQVTRVMRAAGIKARSGQSGSGDTLVGYRDRVQALGVTPHVIRRWARQQGIAVGERGAIRGEVIDAFEAAHS